MSNLSSCQIAIVIVPALQVLIIAISNFLLMRRVGPLYGNSARVVYGLHFLFLASYAAAIVLSMETVIALLRELLCLVEDRN